MTSRAALLLALLAAPASGGSVCWESRSTTPSRPECPRDDLQASWTAGAGIKLSAPRATPVVPCPQLTAVWSGRDIVITVKVTGVARTPGARLETIFVDVHEGSLRTRLWNAYANVAVGPLETTLRWRARDLWWACEGQCLVALRRASPPYGSHLWVILPGPKPCPSGVPLTLTLVGTISTTRSETACRWISFNGTVAATGRLTLRAPEVRLLSGARVLAGGRLEVGR